MTKELVIIALIILLGLVYQAGQNNLTNLKSQLHYYQTQLANSHQYQGWQTQQAQLRQINVLFDPAAQNYEVIDFNGLYKLLEQVAAKEKNNHD